MGPIPEGLRSVFLQIIVLAGFILAEFFSFYREFFVFLKFFYWKRYFRY